MHKIPASAALLLRTPVTTYDPNTLAGALGVTALMVALAAAIPARRAAGVQPMQALREE